jgi:two-component system sensor histidine kinase BarA
MPSTITDHWRSGAISPEPRRRPRVLLADDTETLRALTSILLQRMGCEVDAVEHGEQALDLARHVRYDLILLDLDMPLMDGMETARAIRSLPSNEATLIIALSAFLEGIGNLNDRWQVFDGEIAKPIGLDRLRQVILKAWPTRSGELDRILTPVDVAAISAI